MKNNDLSNLIEDKEYQNENFLNILSSYACGKELKIDDLQIDWNYLSSLAVEQGLGCFLYKAIQNHCDADKKVLNELEYYYQKALFSCAARNELLMKVSSAFEENEIDFLILKGAVIQGYYPSPEMRVMSDIDFLVPSEQRKNARNVLESIGLKFKIANSYQDIYVDCNSIIVELHHELWGYDIEETHLFSNVWNKKNLLSGKKHTYLLSNEDFYIFMIAHTLKHFKESGIGIRPLFDLWYFLKKHISDFDFGYIKKELSKFDAVGFEKRLRELINCIFLNKEKSKECDLIIKYLLKCQTHGTEEISLINDSAKKSYVENIISKIFPPLSFMKRRYRILEKIPFLIPVFWLVRIVTLPFKKDRLNNSVAKLKKVNSEEKQYINSVYIAAGIKKKSDKSGISYILALIIIIFALSIFCVIFFQNDSIQHPEYVSSVSEESNETVSDEISVNGENVYGTISWKGGIYVGYLTNNIPNGTGEHIVENKLRYVGVFLNGMYDGLGKIEYSDGSYYEGMFKDGQSNGEGTLYCANGDIINGTFTNGQPGGFCNYEYSDGNLFVGTMIKGLKHGEGTFYWLNGDKYVGSFVNDLRDGYGVLTYSNGDSYVGNWMQGFCSGYGVYTWKDGKKYEGYFENGIMNDTECKITYPDGSVYVGEISDGKQNGKGTITYSNGDIAKGTFVFGYLSGEAEYYFAEKKIWTKVIYEKGVIVKYIIS